MTPLVTFIVPCYKLAHYLAECVDSILSQTYTNLEVLIMDDCSPDNTPEVAQSFNDPRVRHVRNEPNLGHLRNYNKGIEMARGKYVWLISADDKLHVPHVLERFVAVMEQRPDVGYAFCSGVELRNGEPPRTAQYTRLESHDVVFKGHDLLKRLLYANCIIAASGMVRKSCYESWGAFPLDLPYAGDWYLWCLFALHRDVAYFAQPMAAYRIHDRSMTATFVNEAVGECIENDLAVLWRIKQHAGEAGFYAMANRCRKAIAYEYARQLTSKKYRHAAARVSWEACEASLSLHASNKREMQWMRAHIHFSVGDLRVQNGASGALESYAKGLREHFWAPKAWTKSLLLLLGKPGAVLRRGASILLGLAAPARVRN